MHTVDFVSDSCLYRIFEITMLSTQIFVQSYTWTHFHSIFLLNLMFTILSTQISFNTIFMHTVVFRSDP